MGELGEDVTAEAAYGLWLEDRIAAAGARCWLVPVGRAAFNALRPEKG